MLSQSSKSVGRSIIFVVAMWLLACAANAQQPSSGTVRGEVVDPSGALVRGASVTIVGANGAERKVVTNQVGAFVINNLAAGPYIVRAAAQGFAPYEKTEVEVFVGKTGKEFGFGGGHKKSSTAPAQSGGGGGSNRGGINSPYGGSGGSPQSGGDDDESPYKLEFSVQIRNLFNHTNGGTPVGNLRSGFFGESVSLAGGFGFGGGGSQAAGNRRIRFEVQFGF